MEVDGEATTTATEETKKAATVGDGGRARVDSRGRGNEREGEKGSQRRDGVSRSKVAEDLDALQMPRSPMGRTPRRNKVADGEHGRGLVDDGEDGDGEDGRRSQLVGEEETEREREREGERERERREEVEQRGGGAGERRAWREKIREVVGFKEPGTAAKRDGEGGERRWRRRKEERDRRRLTAREERKERGTKDDGVIVDEEGRRGRQRRDDGNEGSSWGRKRRKEREVGNEGLMEKEKEKKENRPFTR